MPVVDKEKIISDFAEETEGYTGADLESLAREAAMLSLREDIKSTKVTRKHFLEEMEKVSPSVSHGDQERYRQIEQNYLKSAKAALLESKSYLA